MKYYLWWPSIRQAPTVVRHTGSSTELQLLADVGWLDKQHLFPLELKEAILAQVERLTEAHKQVATWRQNNQIKG
jgi:hypothetical protein